MKITRREFLPVVAGAALAGCAAPRSASLPGKSVVAIVKASSYSDELAQRILEGVKQCGLNVKGKRVLLKPNLVEFDKSTSINTDVSVLAASLEVMRQLGAADVKIGEGPGHRRDTVGIAEEASYRQSLPQFDQVFVDLNRDDVSPIGAFANQQQFYLPNTALGADLIVSVAKMKTHHWSGATLSMKNFFGTVPGALYGWPKNLLHHIGIERSILELQRVYPNRFAIVDGIVGMEGNGPIQGTPVQSGVLVMGHDLVAVDATCCRLMGIDPAKVGYLAAATHLGHLDEDQIEHRGENVTGLQKPYQLLADFRGLRLA